MKCPYCGGEVQARSLQCPYCGRENAEAIAFQEEINRKIERNKLLKPFLIRQKTPELVQRMLTRIILVVTVGNILLFALSLGIYMWAERGNRGNASPGSHAGEYLEALYGDGKSYWGVSFMEQVNDFVDVMEAGEEPDAGKIEDLVRKAWYMVRESEEYGTQQEEEAGWFLRAFFVEYIGVAEEEVAFLLEYDADGEDSRRLPEQEIDAAARAIADRIKERMP